MAAQFNIEFPASDIRAIVKSMDRAQKELGVTVGQSVKMAAGAVLRSMGASTKVSPKKRPPVVVETMVETTRKNGKAGRPRKVKKYGVNVYTRLGPVFQAVNGARNIADVKRSKLAEIHRRGLAKSAWVRIADRARIGVPGEGSASGATKSKAWQKTAMEYNFKGNDPFAKMINRLPYAMSALAGGPSDFRTAMERGARAMMHTIDDKLKKVLAKTA